MFRRRSARHHSAPLLEISFSDSIVEFSRIRRSRSRSLSPPPRERPQHPIDAWLEIEEAEDQMPDHSSEEENASTASSCSSSSDGLSPGGPEEMKFSLASNLLFLVGASIQTAVASWDVRDANADAKWQASGMDDGDDDSGKMNGTYLFYFILNSAGPFFYIVNACVDAKLATTLPEDNPLAANAQFDLLLFAWKRMKMDSDNSDSINEDEILQEFLDEEVQEEINEKLWELFIAIIFGIGAVLEFISTLFDFGNMSDNGSLTASKLNVVSMHVYLTSGLLQIHKDRRLIIPRQSLVTCGRSKARTLMGWGLILFLTGSILDCIMSYLYDPDLVLDNLFTPLQLAWYNLVTTLLWNTNAVLFICADCLIYDLWNQVARYRRLIHTPQSPSSILHGHVALPLLEVAASPRSLKTEHVV